MRRFAVAVSVVVGLAAGGSAVSLRSDALAQQRGTPLDIAVHTGSTLPLDKRLTVKFGIIGPRTPDAVHPMAGTMRGRPSGLDIVTETTRIPLHPKSTGFHYGIRIVDREAHLYAAKREQTTLRIARTVLDGGAAKAGLRPLPADKREWTPDEQRRVENFLTTGYFNFKTAALPVDGIALRYVVRVPDGRGQPYDAPLKLNTDGTMMMYNVEVHDEPGPRVIDVYANGTLFKSIAYTLVRPASGDKTPLPFSHCAHLIGNANALRECRPKL